MINQDLYTAAKLLQEGQVVAFPTETIYGLGARFDDPHAIKKIYEIKGRPSNNPLIAHIATLEQLPLLIRDTPTPEQYRLMESFWPGPLTLIFAKHPNVPDEVCGGLDTIAIRMPDHPIARDLIHETGVPLVAPSANPSGCPSPTHHQHVNDYFGEDLYCLNGGFTKVGLESTILIFKDNQPIILRPGAISREEIESILQQRVSLSQPTHTPLSPGMMYRHYAPEAQLHIAQTPAEIQDVLDQYQHQPYPLGLLLSDQTIHALTIPLGVQIKSLGDKSNLEEISRNIFQTFIAFDHTEVEHIWTEEFPQTGLGLAIMDKLRRASQKE